MADEVEVEIIGPGENETERLITNIQVLKGSVFDIATGKAEEVAFLKLTSRSLASYTELQVHHFGMTKAQAEFTAEQLTIRSSEL